MCICYSHGDRRTVGGNLVPLLFCVSSYWFVRLFEQYTTLKKAKATKPSIQVNLDTDQSDPQVLVTHLPGLDSHSPQKPVFFITKLEER